MVYNSSLERRWLKRLWKKPKKIKKNMKNKTRMLSQRGRQWNSYLAISSSLNECTGVKAQGHKTHTQINLSPREILPTARWLWVRNCCCIKKEVSQPLADMNHTITVHSSKCCNSSLKSHCKPEAPTHPNLQVFIGLSSLPKHSDCLQSHCPCLIL